MNDQSDPKLNLQICEQVMLACPRAPVVAIVSPSGYAPAPEAVERGILNLRAQRCEVRNLTDHASRFQRFGADDAARIDQLYAAVEDPAVDIVLALRGGYGLTRLLPHIDFARLANNGKLFVGHSDFTALQMGLLASSELTTFSGPMLCDDFVRPEPSAYTLCDFWHCLLEDEHQVTAIVEGNPTLELEGQVWGGNLAMLTHLVGSPYLPDIENGILFVEDINEHPYRVERMLLQLAHAGILQKQGAVLLGDFSGYRLTEYDNGYDFGPMVEWMRQQIQVPILTGLPVGHGRDKATMAVGAQATLCSDSEGFSLTMRGYPTLKQRLQRLPNAR